MNIIKKLLKRTRQFVRKNRDGILFFVFFIGYFFAGQVIYYFIRDITAPVLVDMLHVRVSAFIINTLTPAEHCIAEGNTLFAAQHTLEIVLGCEGIDSIIIIIAALAAYRSRIGWKLTGITLGTLILYVVNIFRITGLFYISKYRSDMFDTMHIVVGQTIIIVAGFIFFLAWNTAESKLKAT